MLFIRAVEILNGYINYLDRSARASRVNARQRDVSRVAEEADAYVISEDAPAIVPDLTHV